MLMLSLDACRRHDDIFSILCVAAADFTTTSNNYFTPLADTFDADFLFHIRVTDAYAAFFCL